MAERWSWEGPEPTGGPYAVTLADQAGEFGTWGWDSLGDMIQGLARLRELFPRKAWAVSNTDCADWASDTGADDGFTEEERDALQEAGIYG